MEPTDIHFRIKDFLKTVKLRTNGVEVLEEDTQLFEQYVQRVVRFLPDAFPTLTFDHQKVWLEELENEMIRAKE